MNLEIPVGLTTLLQDFTVAVLRERPADLVQFAADYFQNLNGDRGGRPTGVSFGGPGDAAEDDEEEDFEPPNLQNRFSRRKSVAAERYDPEADEDEDEPRTVNPKSDVQRRSLQEAVKPILLFRSLDEEQMSEVLDAMFERKVTPGEHIIDQGDDGDNFYVIDSGKYDIFVDINGKMTNVGAYDGKGSFGELALMYNMPRAATIIAKTDGILWAMDRKTFRRIVLKSAYQKRKKYETLLASVPMLQQLNGYELMNVADALFTKSYQDGHRIIKQGDEADCMYFVEDGQVVIKRSQGEGLPEVEVTQCRQGQYFGELALITHKPRAASAYSLGRCKLAVLDVHAFERLLGPCKDLMQRNITDYEQRLAEIFGEPANMADLR